MGYTWLEWYRDKCDPAWALGYLWAWDIPKTPLLITLAVVCFPASRRWLSDSDGGRRRRHRLHWPGPCGRVASARLRLARGRALRLTVTEPSDTSGNPYPFTNPPFYVISHGYDIWILQHRVYFLETHTRDCQWAQADSVTHLETHTRSQTPHFMSYPMDMTGYDMDITTSGIFFWQNVISMSYPCHIWFSKKIYLDIPGIS